MTADGPKEHFEGDRNVLKMDVGDGCTIMYILWCRNYAFTDHTSKNEGMVQSIQFFPCKNKDLNLIPRIHVKNPGSVLCGCNPNTRQGEAGITLRLPGQPAKWIAVLAQSASSRLMVAAPPRLLSR